MTYLGDGFTDGLSALWGRSGVNPETPTEKKLYGGPKDGMHVDVNNTSYPVIYAFVDYEPVVDYQEGDTPKNIAFQELVYVKQEYLLHPAAIPTYRFVWDPTQ